MHNRLFNTILPFDRLLDGLPRSYVCVVDFRVLGIPGGGGGTSGRAVARSRTLLVWNAASVCSTAAVAVSGVVGPRIRPSQRVGPETAMNGDCVGGGALSHAVCQTTQECVVVTPNFPSLQAGGRVEVLVLRGFKRGLFKHFPALRDGLAAG